MSVPRLYRAFLSIMPSFSTGAISPRLIEFEANCFVSRLFAHSKTLQETVSTMKFSMTSRRLYRTPLHCFEPWNIFELISTAIDPLTKFRANPQKNASCHGRGGIYSSTCTQVGFLNRHYSDSWRIVSLVIALSRIQKVPQFIKSIQKVTRWCVHQ
jgi:hypothetical protein